MLFINYIFLVLIESHKALTQFIFIYDLKKSLSRLYTIPKISPKHLQSWHKVYLTDIQ